MQEVGEEEETTKIEVKAVEEEATSKAEFQIANRRQTQHNQATKTRRRIVVLIRDMTKSMCNAITIISLVIMLVNVRRNSMTMEAKMLM